MRCASPQPDRRTAQAALAHRLPGVQRIGIPPHDHRGTGAAVQGAREHPLPLVAGQESHVPGRHRRHLPEPRAKGGARSWRTRPTTEQAAEAMVAYEAKHQGEFGFYRVVFTALVEADDPEIRAAITSMYRRFHDRLRRADRNEPSAARKTAAGSSADATAWATDRPGDRLQHHPRAGTAAAPATRRHVRAERRSIWCKATRGSRFSFAVNVSGYLTL